MGRYLDKEGIKLIWNNIASKFKSYDTKIALITKQIAELDAFYYYYTKNHLPTK